MQISNTLTRAKTEFQPKGDVVTMYVCGVTPYSEAHVGHAMSNIVFDTIRRYLEWRGYRVKYVQNFTDVDDKIIARANRLGIPAEQLAEQYIASYLEDMQRLNIREADVHPRVTTEMPTIIEFIEKLIESGHAYEAGGDVYFRVRKDPEYGKLSHRDIDDLESGIRVEPGANKEDPLDFALWKAAKPGEPAWQSPWGPGRPGWHIECSAMAYRHLGEQIDIHGGGQDLIFPHHENEIAQSEAFTGKRPFVRYWLHNGLLRLGEEKMSKSLGNLVTIKDAVAQFGADAIRLFVLSSYYRSPLTYTDEALESAQKGAQRLAAALEGFAGEPASQEGDPYRERFIKAMDDDFNTAAAVAVLFDLAREINRIRSSGGDPTPQQATLKQLAGVLGLRLDAAERSDSLAAKPFVDLLVQVRAELRAAKQFQLADRIRDGLSELGVILEDTPQGTTWKQKR